MTVWVIGPEELLNEWKLLPADPHLELHFSTARLPDLRQEQPDSLFYLHEDLDDDITDWLESLPVKFYFVNAMLRLSAHLPEKAVRINGWPGFLQRSVAELATGNSNAHKPEIDRLISLCGRQPEWVPDCYGMLSARVLAMIINEAWFALEESVSTAEEIDVAMKLGTNYPNGPLEWGKMIGLKRIVELLNLLENEDVRYRPSSLLKSMALAQ